MEVAFLEAERALDFDLAAIMYLFFSKKDEIFFSEI